jgi:hypothetical protein
LAAQLAVKASSPSKPDSLRTGGGDSCGPSPPVAVQESEKGRSVNVHSTGDFLATLTPVLTCASLLATRHRDPILRLFLILLKIPASDLSVS